jgi:hypothetical protein
LSCFIVLACLFLCLGLCLAMCCLVAWLFYVNMLFLFYFWTNFFPLLASNEHHEVLFELRDCSTITTTVFIVAAAPVFIVAAF